MKGYQVYIFDLDGTLLDTLDDLAVSCNHALEAFSMPRRTKEEVRMFVGNGVRTRMKRAVPGGEENPEFEQVLESFRSHYLVHGQDHTAPYPGIVDMLAYLRRHGRKIAVVSNKFDGATRQLCDHFFPHLVDVAVGEREGIRRKPAPDMVMEVMRLLNVSAADCVYVGDSDTDIPCMKLVNSYGGHAIGVYDDRSLDKSKVHKMILDNRIRYYAPADYREGSQLDELVKMILDRTAANEKLESFYQECLKEAGHNR